MGAQFLILIGPGASHLASHGGTRAGTHLRPIVETPRLAIYACDAVSRNAASIGRYRVLGLHRRRHQSPPDDRGEWQPRSISALFAFAWGPYVAVDAEEQATVRVAREPSGQMPCYYARVSEDGWAFASDVRLLRRLRGQVFTIDWDALVDQLHFPGNFGRQTAIKEIKELLPGECATISAAGMAVETIWSPWSPHTPSACTSTQEATELVRLAFREVREALEAWFEHPLLTVSGGLDSAIVATELASGFTMARCVNLYTPSAAGDERLFARDVAAACGFPLEELPFAYPDMPSPLDAGLPRPTERFISTGSRGIFEAIASAGCHDVILTGFGGDSVFCLSYSSLPLSDLLKADPSLKEVRTCVADIATLTGASYPQILKHALGSAWRRARSGRSFTWPQRTRFLRGQVDSRRGAAPTHPWLNAPRGGCSGKAHHIAALLRAHTHLEQSSRSGKAGMFAPLLATPILKACLAIPTWMWISGGRDRAIARAASRHLPRSIIARSTKGTPGQMLAHLFEERAPFLVGMLLEGELATRGIIDADALRSYARAPTPRKDNDYLMLFELIDAEQWVRSWSSPSR